jgi:hypothetical protein
MSGRVCRAYREVGNILYNREIGKRSITAPQTLRLQESCLKFGKYALAAHDGHIQGRAEERKIGLSIVEIEFQPFQQLVAFTQHSGPLAIVLPSFVD